VRQPGTLVELLSRAAEFPEPGVRLLDRAGKAEWLAWPAIQDRARRVCGALQAAGVSRAERVALIFPTGADFLDTLFGTILAGAVPVPMYPPVQLGRLDEYFRRTSAMLAAADVCLIVADRRVARILGDVVRRVRPRLGCVAPGQLADAPAVVAGVVEDDLGLIQFSSGTTSDPKPVALSHRAIVAQAALLNTFWPDSGEVRHSGVSWLPLYHDMGLIGTIFTALERPGTVTLIPPEVFVARPAVWLRTLSDYGATISPAPTFGYGHSLQRIRDDELDGVDLSRWRVALCGGETVVPEVLRAFGRRFARWGFAPGALTPVYGLSEAALAVTFSDLALPFTARRFERSALADDRVARDAAADDAGLELASLGRPVPGFEIRVTDAEGRSLAERCVGRVECRGPSVMTGYFRQPEETSRVVSNGWLDTGDLGFLLDGELYLAGREKDVLIIRGRNHAPEEVERAAESVPGARVGRVVAVSWLPEGADGERLLTFVEARQGVREAEFDDLARTSSDAIVAATGLTPAGVIVVAHGTLPRTSSGKLRRGETLKQYLAGTLASPAQVTPLRLAGMVARSWWAYRRTPKPPGKDDAND
jgi:fatty-acyl-CoA synthase